MIAIILGILFYTGVVNAGMDTIKYNPSEFCLQTAFWLSRGDYTPAKRTWLKRYVFTFLADGWHLLKTIMVLLISITVFISAQGVSSVNICFGIPFIIAGYLSFSAGFLVGYNYFWLRR
jgi:hypothetical protein